MPGGDRARPELAHELVPQDQGRAAQKIYFPAKNSPEITSLPKADAAAMSKYAGRQMTTGAQAETYADHFIAVHLTKIGGGQTYSQLSGKARRGAS